MNTGEITQLNLDLLRLATRILEEQSSRTGRPPTAERVIDEAKKLAAFVYK